MPRSRPQPIACQQVLEEDSSVFSIQWSVFRHDIARGLTPAAIRRRYLEYIRSCTLSLIRPTATEAGVEFRLLTSPISLISFLPPDDSREGQSVLRIRGGVLVQPRQCHRGELRFGMEESPEGVRISLLLCDYCPLILGGPSPSPIRFWLYRLTQALIHRLVTVRFLTLLYRDLAGPRAPVRLVRSRLREGRPL